MDNLVLAEESELTGDSCESECEVVTGEQVGENTDDVPALQTSEDLYTYSLFGQ